MISLTRPTRLLLESRFRPLSLYSHLENGAKTSPFVLGSGRVHTVHVPSSGLTNLPPPGPTALAPLLLPLPPSVCLSASLPDPTPLLLSGHWLRPLLSSFPQNNPESLPQVPTFPPELWTLPSLLWHLEDAAGLPASPALPSPVWLPPHPRLSCMASFLPTLLFVATPAHSSLACWHAPGFGPGPFSFVSPWGSHLLLWFHSSILPCLGWTWGSVVVKTELTLSRTSAPNSIETAPFSEDVCSPSAVLEPDGTTEPHPREHRVRPEQKRLWKSRSVGPRGSGARRAERCKEPMGAA